MTLDAALRAEVERATGCAITAAASVGGGCISPAYHLTCADGTSLFLKTAPAGAPDDMLVREAASLRRIGSTATVRVPRVRAGTAGWLALEWLPPAAASAGAWAQLGRSLARLHRSRAPRYGAETPNCIGALPQSNEWTDDWPSFWRQQRLEPQLRRARPLLDALTVARFARLLDELDERLAGAAIDGPSLLHGDLWHGNVHFTAEGAALIDPSSYYGHREVDLAMAALFGGFPGVFFDAYSADWPLQPGTATRRPIYQLYYLLVHVNLFGGGYAAQTRSVLESIVS